MSTQTTVPPVALVADAPQPLADPVALERRLEHLHAVITAPGYDAGKGDVIFKRDMRLVEEAIALMVATPAQSAAGIAAKLRIFGKPHKLETLKDEQLIGSALKDAEALAGREIAAKAAPRSSLPIGGAMVSLIGEYEATSAIFDHAVAGGPEELAAVRAELNDRILATRATDMAGLLWKLDQLNNVVQMDVGCEGWIEKMVDSILSDAADLSVGPAVPVISIPDPVAQAGRQIANIFEAMKLIEDIQLNEGKEGISTEPMLEQTVDNLNDLRIGLEKPIQTTRATTIPGAMVQIMVAFSEIDTMISYVPMPNQPDLEPFRRRLESMLYSVLGVLVQHTGINPASLGADLYMISAADPHARMESAVAGKIVAGAA